MLPCYSEGASENGKRIRKRLRRGIHLRHPRQEHWAKQLGKLRTPCWKRPRLQRGLQHDDANHGLRGLLLFCSRSVTKHDGTAAAKKVHSEKTMKAVRQDKRIWLESTLVGGSWKAVRKLKKTPAKTPVTIKSADGEVVESNQRANVLPDYFEREQ